VAAPKIQILYRRNGDMLFGWNSVSQTEAKSFNVYQCNTVSGVYSFLKTIQNHKDKTYNKVICLVKDTDIPISNPVLDTWYFKITEVTSLGAESDINLSLPCVVYPHNVEWYWENEDEPKNNHNFGWVESRKRWEKLKINDDGSLATDANVNIDTIQLGNVKVAQKPDNTTLDYILIDNNRETIVRNDPNSIIRVSGYNEVININRNVETTVLTFTNALPYFVEKVSCSGSADAVFKLKIDGITTRVLRNAWNDRNVTFDFSTIARKISANSVVTITAIHNEKAVQKFEASLEAFTFTI
jgi:hypothetical protein